MKKQFKPYAYQQYCINRVISDEKLGLFLDMGLGKTVISLTAINELKYNRFLIRKVLIIAPKKVAEITWSQEQKKWEHLKMLRISMVLGSQTSRMRALNTNADIYVINRENVPWLVEYYNHNWPFDMVIIDELSNFKSHSAKRFKALKLVRNRITRLVGLTGTPRPNTSQDLWAQIYLLDQGERLGKTITQFRNRWLDSFQITNTGMRDYTAKPGAEDLIARQISDICISMSADDYLQLPDIIYNDIPVGLDKKSEAKYKKLEKEMLLQIDPETVVSAPSAISLSNKLLQLCNGAIYDEDRQVHEIHDCKIEVLLETLEKLNSQSALVFYNYKHDRDRILKVLPGARELKTPQDQEDWNNGKIKVLLAHPQSAAYGLNLQEGGNHVIWFGLSWSLELYQQANKRLHRQGQKNKVFIHHLAVVGGRDEDVLKALQDKDNAQQALLDSLKARIEAVKR